MVAEFGSLAAYVWPHGTFGAAPEEIPALTESSTAMSKDLKRRGWSFVGPTTVYAFMQAMGLVNDHLEGCWVREDAERRRRATYAAVVA
jgi:DNA-3-methyladenine glycosylase I